MPNSAKMVVPEEVEDVQEQEKKVKDFKKYLK